jgi:hypothetical protein
VGVCSVAIDDGVNACAPLYLQVIEENVYDAVFAASADLGTDIGLISSGVAEVLADTGTTGVALADNSITAAKIAAGAIDAATFAADVDAEARSWLGLASANLDTQLGDLPTGSELTTALAAADDAVLAAIAALNNLSAAQVATEVADALATDTYAEPSGVPSATTTLAVKIGYLYMALRNGLEVTASAKTFLDDSGAAEWSKALADDGTTFSEDEASAP